MKYLQVKQWSYLAIVLSLASCESFLEVDPPDSKIPVDLVFANDLAAESAMAGMYLNLQGSNNFSSGSDKSVGSVGGLSADELHNYPLNPQNLQFENNNLEADNADVLLFWESMYRSIYITNSILEGLERSTGMTPTTKAHLRGEALFIRAFSHFYLVNFFGDVPIVITTDYTQNAVIARSPIDEVYEQILLDLQEAENLLVENYITTGRVRPNKHTVTAMLARVYLYREDWARAEEKAGNVITRNLVYSLTSNLDLVFRSNSAEAIWQLRVQDGAQYTNEGYYFGTSRALNFNVLRNEVIDDFEPGDLRRTSWITTRIISGETVYYPYKYKLQTLSGPESNEYSTVFRLAEMFLIRSEARARQGKLVLAIADIDEIRRRANLPLIQETNPSISEDDLILAIEQERRIEFLAEWGHRWLDLKRWDRANTVLATKKPGWTTDDQLYPLPAHELRNNPKLKPQNPGY